MKKMRNNSKIQNAIYFFYFLAFLRLLPQFTLFTWLTNFFQLIADDSIGISDIDSDFYEKAIPDDLKKAGGKAGLFETPKQITKNGDFHDEGNNNEIVSVSKPFICKAFYSIQDIILKTIFLW